MMRTGIAEVPSDTQPHLNILLQFADSSITYRTRYLSVLRTDLVLQLLLLDETNPRSIGFQLAGARKIKSEASGRNQRSRPWSAGGIGHEDHDRD